MSLRDRQEEFRRGYVPKNIQERLIEFHRTFDVPILDVPTVPSDERVRLRASLIVEECLEFLEACFDQTNSVDAFRLAQSKQRLKELVVFGAIKVDLPEAADALADIAYVVEGANLEFGIDSGPVLDEVHRANMAKVGGPIREDGKRLKPPRWRGPDIERVLRKQRDVSED